MRQPADVRLLDIGFDAGRGVAEFANSHLASGGIASFIGQVREEAEALELTHYPPLTLPGMTEIADTALDRWQLGGLLVWHRVGRLGPGEPIVLVAAAARHRRAAFEAVDFTMDHLKSAAWFWKRELRGGEWTWIEPRPEDRADLGRWT